MKRLSIKKFIPGIAWFFVVMALTCTPGDDLPKEGIFHWLNLTDFDKLVHAGIFGLLAVLFCYPFAKADLSYSKKIKYFIIICLLTAVWGYCIEVIQLFWVEGRTYDLFDWTADSIGALLAFFFSWKVFL